MKTQVKVSFKNIAKRCKVCDRKFFTPVSSDEFCSSTCKKVFLGSNDGNKDIVDVILAENSLGVDKSFLVDKIVKSHKVSTPNREKGNKKRCLYCGVVFWTKIDKSKYCSKKCFNMAVKEKKHAPNFDEERHIVKCKYCGEKFPRSNATHKFCSKECSNNYRIEEDYKKGSFLILDRDRFTCIYCGETSFKDCSRLHIDHILPKSKGGRDIAENLATSCSRCNLEKNNKISQESIKSITTQIRCRNRVAGISNKMVIKLRRGK